jgi:hypothetical protein
MYSVNGVCIKCFFGGRLGQLYESHNGESKMEETSIDGTLTFSDKAREIIPEGLVLAS